MSACELKAAAEKYAEKRFELQRAKSEVAAAHQREGLLIDEIGKLKASLCKCVGSNIRHKLQRTQNGYSVLLRWSDPDQVSIELYDPDGKEL